MTFSPSSDLPSLPIETALSGLRIPALPVGTSARGMLALIKLDEPDDGVGWSVRVTADLSDEEVLGVLIGYVEHLKAVSAASWSDSEPTQA